MHITGASTDSKSGDVNYIASGATSSVGAWSYSTSGLTNQPIGLRVENKVLCAGELDAFSDARAKVTI